MPESLFNSFRNSPLGLIMLIFIAIYNVAIFIPEEGESNTKVLVAGIIYGLAIIVYAIYLCNKKRLPKARKNALGVLFVINALNEKIYDDVKFNFKNSLEEVSDDLKYCVQPVFISSSQVANYNIANKKVIMNILSETNCIFCVNVIYKVDDSQNTYNYEMVIQTNFVNDAFSDNIQKVLRSECERVSKSFEKVKFTKDEKIKKLEVTARTIKNVSEYIIALMFLFSGNHQHSLPILKELYESSADDDPVKEGAKKGYYYSLNDLFCDLSEDNQHLKNTAGLTKAEEILEKMNTLYPDTYRYHLNMASIVFLKYRNIEKSLYHVNFCKKLGVDDSWKYSKAFITAYCSNNVFEVLDSYRIAIKSKYNVQTIIEYIETVLEIEPDKVMLHFALGILYSYIGDNKLALEHLNMFYNDYRFAEQELTIKQKIQKIIGTNQCASCQEDECNRPCFSIELI